MIVARLPLVALVALVGSLCGVVLWYSFKMMPDEALIGANFRDGMNVISDESSLRRNVERPFVENPTEFPTTEKPPTNASTTL
ncbi:unnamed protein product [Aphanomyces euteiches]